MQEYMNKQEPILFKVEVAASGSVTLEARPKADGTIERMYVNFNLGHEGTLHVVPMLIKNGKNVENLVTYVSGGQQYLSGDDDYLNLDCSLPCDDNDIIRVVATNTDAVNAHTLDVCMIVDYYGGKARVK